MKQIVILHTESDYTADSYKKYTSCPAHYIIYRNGSIESFLDEHSKFELNLNPQIFEKNGLNYRTLEDDIISVALVAWGSLRRVNGEFYPNKLEGYKISDIIPVKNVYEYCPNAKWKNNQYWEPYTEKQIEALRHFLYMKCREYNIPSKYNPDMWDISRKALSGSSGIWAHVSLKKGVTDPHPQIELVNMLKLL